MHAPPGRTLLAVALLALATALPVLAGCGGSSSEPTATTATSGVAPQGDAANGATVWESAGCGSCHALQAAGSSGSVGPDLDDLKPDSETVVAQVTNGGGGMPAFADSLSEQEILDVAAYVVQSTSG